MLRTVVLLNLVKSMIIYHDSLSIFWQFNASLLNPLILQKKTKTKNIQSPNLCTVVYLDGVREQLR